MPPPPFDPVNGPRFCVRCGRSKTTVEFRTSRTSRCLTCDALAQSDRKAYQKEYHAARGRAVSRLIRSHREQFQDLLEDELYGDDPGPVVPHLDVHAALLESANHLPLGPPAPQVARAGVGVAP